MMIKRVFISIILVSFLLLYQFKTCASVMAGKKLFDTKLLQSSCRIVVNILIETDYLLDLRQILHSRITKY